MHLLTPDLQRMALLNIRDNLADNGMLTFNTFDPDPVFQAQQINTKDTDYTLRVEYTNKDGNHKESATGCAKNVIWCVRKNDCI